jgi:hypothetical protein
VTSVLSKLAGGCGDEPPSSSSEREKKDTHRGGGDGGAGETALSEQNVHVVL